MVETNYAVALAETNRAEEALHHRQRALQLDPNAEETQVDMGCVLRQLGQAQSRYLFRASWLSQSQARARALFFGRALLDRG